MDMLADFRARRARNAPSRRSERGAGAQRARRAWGRGSRRTRGGGAAGDGAGIAGAVAGLRGACPWRPGAWHGLLLPPQEPVRFNVFPSAKRKNKHLARSVRASGRHTHQLKRERPADVVLRRTAWAGQRAVLAWVLSPTQTTPTAARSTASLMGSNQQTPPTPC